VTGEPGVSPRSDAAAAAYAWPGVAALSYASIFNKVLSPVMSKRRKTSGWRVLIVS
jgi:hypothetical protein